MALSFISHGLDIVEVSRIRALLEKNGDRFARRIFTEGEVAYCSACADPAIHYAARFAAKEAVSKALGTGFSDGVGWSDIGVRRGPRGAPQIELTGVPAELAASLGIKEWRVSLSHTDQTAAASVIALG